MLLPHFYLCCTHCIISEILLNHPNSFCRGMSKPNVKFDADFLLNSLSHFECDSNTVHMLTQWHLPPPSLTSTVKLSLFIHEHSSSLSLAARLHWCHVNHSCYINNGWAFSRQASYRFGFPKFSVTQLWCIPTMFVASSWIHFHIIAIGSGRKRYSHQCEHKLMLPAVFWVMKSIVFNPGISCFLPACMELW